MERKLLFSVTRDDFEIDTFTAGGKGGQHQNRSQTGIRLTHRASGATGEARDDRSQYHNKKNALLRLVASPKWKAWHRMEVARRLGLVAAAEEAVERQMNPSNLRVEVRTAKGWTRAEELI